MMPGTEAGAPHSADNVFVVDLDGTLLNDEGRLSSYSLTALDELNRRDIPLIICTGRNIEEVNNVLLPVANNKNLIISYCNGRYISIPAKRQTIRREGVSENDCRTIVFICEQNEIHFYSGTDSFSLVSTAAWKTVLSCISNRARSIALSTRAYLFREASLGNIDKLWIYSKDAARTCSMLNSSLSEGSAAVINHGAVVEVVHERSTKLGGVQFIIDKMGFNPKSIVVYGDDLNDLCLFQADYNCYAVNNAVPEIKALAREVIASNNDDGVAKHIYTTINTGRLQ